MARAFLGFELGPDSDLYIFSEQARHKVNELPAGSPDASILTGELAMTQGMMDVISGQRAGAIVHAQKAMQLPPRQAFFARSYVFAALACGHQMEGNASQGYKVLRDSLKDPDWPDGIRARMWMYLSGIAFMDADSSEALYAGRECLKITGTTRFIQPRSGALFYLGATHYLRNEIAEAKDSLSDII